MKPSSTVLTRPTKDYIHGVAANLVPDWGRRFGALPYSGLLAAIFMKLAPPGIKMIVFRFPMLERKSWLTMEVM